MSLVSQSAVNIAAEIECRFPEGLVTLLREAGELAERRSQQVYLVGGAVRDLFLGRANLDIDLVVEGAAIPLARELARGRGGEVKTHPRFGTANVRVGDFRIDVVSARSESYPRPGALPEVKAGTIYDDLLRRDISINVMAVRLARPHFGELFDPYGGKQDLDRGVIRVLHSRSFRDDPTRILRALRHEQRLGFRLDRNTMRLVRRDAVVLGAVSGDRLRHELELILEEDCPERVLSRAGELGVLRHIHPALSGNGRLAARFRRAREVAGGSPPDPKVYLALWVWRLTENDNEEVIRCLRFGGEAARAMRQAVRLKSALPNLRGRVMAPSAIYRVLRAFSPDAVRVAAMATETPLIRERLELYLGTLRQVQPFLDGEDLKRLGVPEGRKLGAMLTALLEARLDGKVGSREDEEELVRYWVSGEQPRGG